jgi:hypothetical protein
MKNNVEEAMKEVNVTWLATREIQSNFQKLILTRERNGTLKVNQLSLSLTTFLERTSEFQGFRLPHVNPRPNPTLSLQDVGEARDIAATSFISSSLVP